MSSRRSFLRTGWWSAAAGVAAAQGLTEMPAGATDAHFHIYDPRFQTGPGKVLTSSNATVPDYRKLQERLGLSRLVAVQPSAYGLDNSCLVDALGQFGKVNARGIAVVNTSVAGKELTRLHAAGVRGIRFNLVQAGATTPEMILPLSNRIAELGWHVQVNCTSAQIVALAGLWESVAVPVLFDHFGHVARIDDPAFSLIVRLIEKGKAWIKISGAETISKTGPPSYDDCGTIAKALVRQVPERVIWGTNWPYVTSTQKPDSEQLVSALNEWIGSGAIRTRVLVTNPARLFGFV